MSVLRRRDVVITLLVSAALSLSPTAQAARAVVDNDAPVMTHVPTPCPAAVDGIVAPCVVEATIVDVSGVFDPTLLVRLRGVSAYERVGMKPVAGRADVYSATVPPAIAAAGDVEYLIEAFDVQGNGPARAGEEAAPLVLLKAPPVASSPSTAAPIVDASEESEDDGSLMLGVVIGASVLALVVAGAVVGVALYASRPAGVDDVRVSVSGPRPFAVTP